MQPGGQVRQPYAEVNFIPLVRDKEFGYWMGSAILLEIEKLDPDLKPLTSKFRS
jgi:hypothetical protein